MKSTTEQGNELEAKIARYLRSSGFEVTVDAKAARPRQTDLFARNEDVDLLIEVKNRRRKIDVGDVDALRSRLNRVTSDIVGVIFATSDLTRGAIEAIETDRRREILSL